MTLEGGNGMLIRKACASDLKGIAKVRVDTWRTTYRGLIPEQILRRLSYAKSAKLFAPLLKRPDIFTHVAEDETGKILGFVCGGAERGGNFDYKGEVYAIYILDEYQKKGIGRLLMRAAALSLKNRGFESMLLWTAAGNQHRSFYEALGGTVLENKRFIIEGVNMELVSYGWSDMIILQR